MWEEGKTVIFRGIFQKKAKVETSRMETVIDRVVAMEGVTNRMIRVIVEVTMAMEIIFILFSPKATFSRLSIYIKF